MKFYISTLGCRLNQAESQELEELLTNQGWHKTDKAEKADLIVINTCVVTRKAERETRKELRRLRRENRQARLVAAGCWVDKINQFGGIEVEGIDEMISNQEKWKMAKGLMLNAQSRMGKQTEGRVLIKIQSGCHNQCAYCLPTLVRGASISVPIERVVKRVQQVVENQVVEAVLTGQNVSQYNDDGKTWVDLVEAVLKQTDIQLLRLGSINPTLVERPDFNYSSGSGTIVEELVCLFHGSGRGRLARHLHLSLQSGSDRILKKMNRNYTTDQFREVVKNLRQNVDGMNITTDVIVGFPGESKEDFQQTLEFCREMKFGKVHVFRYSPRKGTLVLQKRREWGRVGSKIKKKRSKKMRKLEKKLRHQFWESQIGKTAVAKIWGTGKGLTDNYIPIKMDLNKKINKPIVRQVRLLAGPNFDILKASIKGL